MEMYITILNAVAFLFFNYIHRELFLSQTVWIFVIVLNTYPIIGEIVKPIGKRIKALESEMVSKNLEILGVYSVLTKRES